MQKISKPVPLSQPSSQVGPPNPAEYTEKHGWHDFESGCPAEGCENMDDKKIKWVHVACGAHEKINSDAELKCMGCGRQNGIMSWKFSCSKHVNKYNKPDITKLSWALSIVVTVVHQKGDKVWANKLLTMSLKFKDE